MTSYNAQRKLAATGLPNRLGQVLLLLADGQTSKQIARQLKKANGEPLSPRTVDTYRNELLFKLRAENTPQLITKAFESGTLKFITLFAAFLVTAQIVLPDDILPRAPRSSTSRSQVARARRCRSCPAADLNHLTTSEFLATDNPHEFIAAWDPESSEIYFTKPYGVSHGTFTRT